MRKLLLTMAIFALGTGLFAQSHRNGSDKKLNLRSEPNASASVITSIPADAKITVIDKSNSEWYKVRYDGKTGYVAAKYVSEDKNQDQATNNQTKNNNQNNTSSKQSNNNSNNNTSSSKAKSKSASNADYKTGIGLRFGNWESGLTVKHFIKNTAAIEGILSTGWMHRGTRLTGLYEVQKPLGSGGFSWFWGGGAHVGLYNERYWYKGDCKDGRYWQNGRYYDCDGTRTTLGIDGIIGIEYLFKEIPFTIGVDFKPSIDILGWGGHYGDAAFTVRYVF